MPSLVFLADQSMPKKSLKAVPCFLGMVASGAGSRFASLAFSTFSGGLWIFRKQSRNMLGFVTADWMGRCWLAVISVHSLKHLLFAAPFVLYQHVCPLLGKGKRGPKPRSKSLLGWILSCKQFRRYLLDAVPCARNKEGRRNPSIIKLEEGGMWWEH